MTEYVPHPNSYAARAVAVLREKPDEWMASPALSARIGGCGGSSIRVVLANAIANGAISLQSRGRYNYYKLGDQPPPDGGERLPVNSVFALGEVSQRFPKRSTATFGLCSDGSINVVRGGKSTERFTPDEVRALARVLHAEGQP